MTTSKKLDALQVLDEDGAFTWAALLIKNLTNYKLSLHNKNNNVSLTARAREPVPLTFKRTEALVKKSEEFNPSKL